MHISYKVILHEDVSGGQGSSVVNGINGLLEIFTPVEVMPRSKLPSCMTGWNFNALALEIMI